MTKLILATAGVAVVAFFAATLGSAQTTATTGATAKAPDEKVGEDKARKAKIGSIKKRASGHRRERFVPPDFARLPITIMRGFLR